MKDYYVMAINPGSTSMKFAIYENETCIIKKQYNYVPEQITRFGLIIEQLDMRRETVEQFIRDIDFDMNQLDAVVGRGGVVPPLQSGAYRSTTCCWIGCPTVLRASTLPTWAAFWRTSWPSVWEFQPTFMTRFPSVKPNRWPV